jgi:WD40 repeat protein
MDGILKVWDLASGTEQRTLIGHGRPVLAVAVTPDGRQVVSASTDRTLNVWDLASGKFITTLVGDNNMLCVATISGRRFVAGDAIGTVHVLELVEPPAAAETM